LNGFHQKYDYDRYGNRTVSLSTGLAYDDASELNSIYNPFNNRLISNQSGAINYDIAGNQTNYGSFSLGYDANNLTKSFTSASGSNGTYAYDGADKRVKKVVTSSNGTLATTYYVYDALGRLAAEYSDQAVTSSGTSWMFTDMLGSVRAITSKAGSSGFGSVTECYDYLPFGRILGSSDNGRGSCHQSDPDNQIDSAIPQKFTGKERDVETGLDYFLARYLSSAQGRFLSVDPGGAGAKQTDPQSWNAYTYTRNNPMLYIDPTGLMYIVWSNTDGYFIEDLRLLGLLHATSNGYVIPCPYNNKDNGLFKKDNIIWYYKQIYVDPIEGGINDASFDLVSTYLTGSGIVNQVLKEGIWAATKGIIVNELANEAVSQALSQIFTFNQHALNEMANDQISEAQVLKAIEKGKRYWDPTHHSVVYAIKMQSGKDLVVAVNPFIRNIKTVMCNYRGIRPRFIPIGRIFH
jgi:RHS repeat-associated protein